MPDLLVLGRIYTLDPSAPIAEAALVSGGRFAAVGSRERCAAAALPGARRIELGAGSAVPGLADAHGHPVLHGRALREVRCEDAASEEECARRAGERSRTLPAGAWVKGRGWDETRWASRRLPTAAALGRFVGDRPALLERVDGHAAWVNAAAMRVAGIGRDTPDPPGGRIVRDERGAPTGVLVDRAQDLVLAAMPQPTGTEIEEAILASASRVVARGLTSVHDAGVGRETLAAYRRLAGSGRLPLRVYAMLEGGTPEEELLAGIEESRSAPPVERLEVRAAKLFADGALGSRGAALHEPYADDPDNRGLLLSDPAELRRRVALLARQGFQPAVHAIGDRACAEVLHAFIDVDRELGLRHLRPRVEHLQVLHPADAPLLGEAGAIASMQPMHAASDARWAVERLGRGTARLAGAYGWRQALRAGARLAFGSDFPVESPDPRFGLFASERRRSPADPAGRPMPGEPLAREEALRAYTEGAAWASFAEGRRGAVREGFDADLTCFDADLFAIDAEALPALGVTWVLVGGRVELEG